jgi:RNA polymerase sigma-70 factor, ECF subfamily
VTAADTHRSIDAIWRIEQAKLIAGLARMVRDVGLAEELAQDALVAALERWPATGIPDNPGAWLMATAKHRAIDRLRRAKLIERKHAELDREIDTRQETTAEDLAAALDDDIGDDLLRLVFTACDPVLSTEAHVALTLRLLCGLTTEEIARAFLVSEPTVAQRIVRAKRTLAEARVPFEVPREAERAARLSSVLGVLYLVFNEGYTATAGDDWMRPQLCEEALRLGRILAELVVHEPEVHGLVALMEIQASRARARVGPSGEPILLSNKTARGGISSSSVGVLPRSSVPNNLVANSAARAAPTRYRPQSPPATHARAPERRRTGHASPRSTRRSLSSRHRRSWSSIVRSRSPLRSVRPRDSRSSTR